MENRKSIIMKIKLVQSGGFLPVTKEAVTEADLSKEECENMLKQIAVTAKHKSSLVRDGIGYTIELNNKEIDIDIEKASGKSAEILEYLKKNMKIVKR